MMQILPFADVRALDLYRKFERGIYRSAKPA
jgi:methyl acetate hydrolase